jgi:hypothetical protein
MPRPRSQPRSRSADPDFQPERRNKTVRRKLFRARFLFAGFFWLIVFSDFIENGQYSSWPLSQNELWMLGVGGVCFCGAIYCHYFERFREVSKPQSKSARRVRKKGELALDTSIDEPEGPTTL